MACAVLSMTAQDASAHLDERLGSTQSTRYKDALSAFLQGHMAKSEWDRAVVAIIGIENVSLHNDILRLILHEARLGLDIDFKSLTKRVRQPPPYFPPEPIQKEEEVVSAPLGRPPKVAKIPRANAKVEADLQAKQEEEIQEPPDEEPLPLPPPSYHAPPNQVLLSTSDASLAPILSPHSTHVHTVLDYEYLRQRMLANAEVSGIANVDADCVDILLSATQTYLKNALARAIQLKKRTSHPAPHPQSSQFKQEQACPARAELKRRLQIVQPSRKNDYDFMADLRDHLLLQLRIVAAQNASSSLRPLSSSASSRVSSDHPTLYSQTADLEHLISSLIIKEENVLPLSSPSSLSVSSAAKPAIDRAASQLFLSSSSSFPPSSSAPSSSSSLALVPASLPSSSVASASVSSSLLSTFEHIRADDAFLLRISAPAQNVVTPSDFVQAMVLDPNIFKQDSHKIITRFSIALD